jgi:hypothetical protein
MKEYEILLEYVKQWPVNFSYAETGDKISFCSSASVCRECSVELECDILCPRTIPSITKAEINKFKLLYPENFI